MGVLFAVDLFIRWWQLKYFSFKKRKFGEDDFQFDVSIFLPIGLG